MVLKERIETVGFRRTKDLDLTSNTVRPVINGHTRAGKCSGRSSRVGAKCRSSVMPKAPGRAFCISFGLYIKQCIGVIASVPLL